MRSGTAPPLYCITIISWNVVVTFKEEQVELTKSYISYNAWLLTKRLSLNKMICFKFLDFGCAATETILRYSQASAAWVGAPPLAAQNATLQFVSSRKRRRFA
jgi:hypothetical protein